MGNSQIASNTMVFDDRGIVPDEEPHRYAQVTIYPSSPDSGLAVIFARQAVVLSVEDTRALRDWLIEQAGLEKADKVLPDWSIKSIEDMGRDRPDPYTTTAEPAFNEGARTPSTEESAVTNAASEREKQLEAEVAAAKKDAETAKQALQATLEATAAAARAGPPSGDTRVRAEAAATSLPTTR